MFLAPLQDFGGAHSLYDPVINLALMTGIENDVRDIVPEREPGIRGVFQTFFWRLS